MPPASRAQGLVTRRPAVSQGPLRASASLRFSLSSGELTLDTPSEVVQGATRKLAGELLRSLRSAKRSQGLGRLVRDSRPGIGLQDHPSRSRRSSRALRAPAGAGRTDKARVSRGFIGRTAPTDSLSPHGGDGTSAWPWCSSTRPSSRGALLAAWWGCTPAVAKGSPCGRPGAAMLDFCQRCEVSFLAN